MIRVIYSRALSVLFQKPLKLWGLSLLSSLLGLLSIALFGVVPGLSLCINVLLSTSMTMLFLRGYRGEEFDTLQLFDCFKDWKTIKRVLCGMGWMSLWIVIWSLIPIVGPFIAIVRMYQYRLTPYILVTEEDVAATEAIKISTERTKGYKGKMFGAELLAVALVILINLLLGLLGQIPYLGVVFTMVQVLFAICVTALGALFFGLLQAAFYEEITNPTMPVTPPVREKYHAPQQEPWQYRPYQQQPEAPQEFRQYQPYQQQPEAPQEFRQYQPYQQQPEAPQEFRQYQPYQQQPEAPRTPEAPQAPEAPKPVTQFCSHCGKKVSANSLFCGYCGSRLI